MNSLEKLNNISEHNKFLAKMYAISTLIFLCVSIQYTFIMIKLPEVNEYLAENYILRVVATFVGFLQLLVQVTFTTRLARSPWWFCWPFLIINIELNALPLSTVMQFAAFPQLYGIMGGVFIFYVVGIAMSFCTHSKLADYICYPDRDFGIINPIRIHICASVMSETIMALRRPEFQTFISLFYVFTAPIAHIIFSLSLGHPKYFKPEKRGYFLLVMMNTLSLYVVFGSIIWFANNATHFYYKW